MSQDTTDIHETNRHSASRTRPCDRCGRERPRNPERLSVTATDHADSTLAYEKYLLCSRCWDHIKSELRRCLA